MVSRFGPIADAIQVTEEPNNPHTQTGGDGSSPNVRRPMIEGVIVAKQEAVARDLPVNVGVAFPPRSTRPTTSGPMSARVRPEFLAALDYVGLDFFPDVFRSVPLEDIEKAAEGVVVHFREANLRSGGIPESVPIRITENGWPTGEGRPPERQAEILERSVADGPPPSSHA